jgi:hypothetical protein
MTAEDREDRLRAVELGSFQDGGDTTVAGDNPEPSPRPLSQEERQQLEHRAKERLADPDFQRRLRTTDRIVHSLISRESP